NQPRSENGSLPPGTQGGAGLRSRDKSRPPPLVCPRNRRRILLPLRETLTMQDRRQSVRDKVFLGAVAEINERASTMDCVVRNISPAGACVEIDEAAKLPED